jgi:hypothetical protein
LSLKLKLKRRVPLRLWMGSVQETGSSIGTRWIGLDGPALIGVPIGAAQLPSGAAKSEWESSHFFLCELRNLFLRFLVHVGHVAVLVWLWMRQPAFFALALQPEKVCPVNVVLTRGSCN